MRAPIDDTTPVALRGKLPLARPIADFDSRAVAAIAPRPVCLLAQYSLRFHIRGGSKGKRFGLRSGGGSGNRACDEEREEEGGEMHGYKGV